jgi:DNA polymerase III delta prime subunit
MISFNDCNWLHNPFNNINFENLSHSIIINGPEGIGKKLLTKKIIGTLTNINNVSLNEEDVNPDIFILNRDKILINQISYRENKNKKTKPKWDELKGKRDLLNFIALSPVKAKNKVAALINADKIERRTQNVLLKTLEEPPDHAYIILTTSRPRVLLDTIYSRSHVINLKPLSNEDKDLWLKSIGLSEYNSYDFPSYYSPIQIYNEIANNNQSNFKEFISILDRHFSRSESQKNIIKDIMDMDIDAIIKLNFFVEFLKIILESKLRNVTLSGIYKTFALYSFSNLKISNLILEINQMRQDLYSVPQINEGHMLNVIMSELLISFKR